MRQFVTEIFEEALRFRILEEEDAAAIEDLICELPIRSSNYSSLWFWGGLIPPALYLVYIRPRLAGYLVASPIAILTYRLKYYHEKRGVLDIMRKLRRALDASSQLLSEIKKRDMITYSFGIQPGMSLRRRRLEFHRMLVTSVLELRTIIENVAKLRNDDSVRSGLLSNFDPPELKSLLELKDLDESSVAIGNAGLRTLLDLLIITGSEMVRVLVVLISAHADMRFIQKAARGVQEVCDALTIKTQELTSVISYKRPSINEEAPHHNASCSQPDESTNIMNVLDGILTGLRDKALSVQQAKGILSHLLSSSEFPSTSSPVQKRSNDDLDIPIKPLSHSLNSSCNINKDMVFEMFVTEDVGSGVELQSYNKLSDENYCQVTPAMISELRAALENRSREFAERERKALANFYGISEEELLRNERNGLHDDLDRPSIETKVEEPSPPKPIPRISIPLSSNLLDAISSRRAATENVLGDTSSDSD